VNLIWSWRKGIVAPENPWNATTLEWTSGHEGTIVHRGPYEFGPQDDGSDFRMQNEDRE